MWYFGGFNGFGQFGRAHASRVLQLAHFESSRISDDILIHPSWSCNFIAIENKLYLSGYSSVKTDEAICLPEKIIDIRSTDKYCLILIHNGRVFKLTRIDLQLQEIKFADLEIVTRKRRLFKAQDESSRGSPAKITHIACGSNLSVAVSSNNIVYNIPSKVHQFPAHEKIVALQCGFEHALILNSNGDIYSWGNGLRGQLGIDDMRLQETPVLVEALAGIKIVSVAASGWHSSAVSSFGDVYTWGFNCNGQLGIRVFKTNSIKNPTVYPLPQLIKLPPCCPSANQNDEEDTCNAVAVFTGVRHTIVKNSCGTILAAGWNAYGQLSILNGGNMVDEFQPIHSLPTGIVDVICGPWCTIFKIKK